MKMSEHIELREELDEELVEEMVDGMDDGVDDGVVGQSGQRLMGTKIVIRKESHMSNDLDGISEQQLYSLYESYGIACDESERKSSNWMLNVIHVRGVDTMSSEDVLSYFNDYDPNSIEWLSELSCNIVFSDEKSAAVAVNDLTVALVVSAQHSTPHDMTVIDSDSLSVPVPPSFRWRLGKAHHKSKALLLRFATIADRKVRSLSSPITENCDHFQERNTKIKRKLNDRQYNDSLDIMVNTKRVRMRMRADDEEEMIKKRNQVQQRLMVSDQQKRVSQAKSIWDRLDNDEEGNYCAIDADLLAFAADNSMKLKRKSVWTRLDSQPFKTYNSFDKSYTTSHSYPKNDLRSKLIGRSSN